MSDIVWAIDPLGDESHIRYLVDPSVPDRGTEEYQPLLAV
jgi:hypothetical protein